MNKNVNIYICLLCVLICVAVVVSIICIPVFFASKVIVPETVQIVISETNSPNKQYKAIIFSRDAGATTGENYRLSIIKCGTKLNKTDTGNVYATDGEFSVEWNDENTLTVMKKYLGREFFKREEIDGIKINYLSPEEVRDLKNEKSSVLQKRE